LSYRAFATAGCNPQVAEFNKTFARVLLFNISLIIRLHCIQACN
jgi:hypothetical protein